MAELAPRALEKNLDIALEDGPAAELDGDPGLIAVLLRNLVDNAVRYTPAGGRVRFAPGPDGTGLAVRVAFPVSGPR